MKLTLIVALAILNIATVDTSDAKARTHLEQLPRQNSSEQVKAATEERSLNSPSQVLPDFQQKPAFLTTPTSTEIVQLSERDRLIQERFQLKIIPARN